MIATSPDIPAGFTQTEAGVIPVDWRIENLDECVRNDAPICYGILMPGKFHDGGVPVIKVKDIMGGRVDESDILLTHPTIDNAYKRSRLRSGDLLITIRGTTGRVAITPKSLDGANITQDTARVRLNGNHSSEFLYFALQARAAQDQIALYTIGQAVKGINIRDVKDVVVPIPPTLAEQEAIAEALGDADALIESLEQLVAKKRHLKQAAMQQLLTGRKRLPGFEGEWETRSMRDCLLDAPDYGINAPGVPFDGSLPAYLRITDIDDDGHLYSDNRVAVDHPSSSDYVLEQNDIAFARTGASVGKTYLYRPSDGRLVFAGFLIRARVDQTKLSPAFLFNFTHTRPYWNWVRVMSMRSGQPGINGNEYASLEFPLPPTVEEQNAIAEILTDMDTEIEAIEAKLAKARQIKQGMMQELLTGRTRLV